MHFSIVYVCERERERKERAREKEIEIKSTSIRKVIHVLKETGFFDMI